MLKAAVSPGVLRILDKDAVSRSKETELIVDDIKRRCARYEKITPAVVKAAMEILGVADLVSDDACNHLYQILSQFAGELELKQYPTIVKMKHNEELQAEGWSPPDAIVEEADRLAQLRTEIVQMSESPLLTGEDMRALPEGTEERHAALVALLAERTQAAAGAGPADWGGDEEDADTPDWAADADLERTQYVQIQADLESEVGMTRDEMIDVARAYRYWPPDVTEAVKMAVEVDPLIQDEANRREVPAMMINTMWAIDPAAFEETLGVVEQLVRNGNPFAISTLRTALNNSLISAINRLAEQTGDPAVDIAAYTCHLTALVSPHIVGRKQLEAALAAAKLDPALVQEARGEIPSRYSKGTAFDLHMQRARQAYVADGYAQKLEAALRAREELGMAHPDFLASVQVAGNLQAYKAELKAAVACMKPIDQIERERLERQLGKPDMGFLETLFAPAEAVTNTVTPPAVPAENQAQERTEPMTLAQTTPLAPPPPPSPPPVETKDGPRKRAPWTHAAQQRIKPRVQVVVLANPGITQNGFRSHPEVQAMAVEMRTDTGDFYNRCREFNLIDELPDPPIDQPTPEAQQAMAEADIHVASFTEPAEPASQEAACHAAASAETSPSLPSTPASSPTSSSAPPPVASPSSTTAYPATAGSTESAASVSPSPERSSVSETITSSQTTPTSPASAPAPSANPETSTGSSGPSATGTGMTLAVGTTSFPPLSLPSSIQSLSLSDLTTRLALVQSTLANLRTEERFLLEEIANREAAIEEREKELLAELERIRALKQQL